MSQNEFVLLIPQLAVLLGIGYAIFSAVRPAHRRLPPLRSASWLALQTGAPAAVGNDPALARYAVWARRWRIAGVVTGYLCSAVWSVVAANNGWPEPGPNGFWFSLLVGWFLGGLVPDLFVRHRRPMPQRVAALGDRSPTRYVTPTARRWLIGSFGLTIVAAVLAVSAGQPLSWRHDALPVLGMLVVAALGIGALVRIARRSHAAANPTDVIVDDTIRATATTRTVSAWTALQFLVAMAMLPDRLDARSWIVGPSVLVGYAAFIGVVAAWAWVPTRMPARRPAAGAAVVA